MKVTPMKIPEVLILEPEVYQDVRGFFLESFNQRAFVQLGIRETFVQDNHSRSVKNVLRGMHYQIKQPQGKLVRAIAGKIFDAAVDLRKSSPNYGKWVGTELTAENHKMMWIPPGFAHGFLVLSNAAEVLYKTTDYYAKEFERALLWNDEDVGITWPLVGEPIISERDRNAAAFKEAAHY
ncbi:MAG TPA: dTDP-4-dehydrorhamnose 3,5-epimerase [Phycisphaerae bacterium]|nr:dTDP-4-dehydrorhamnose 3,5-epimerase [Phycisphaerae bacterium]